MADRDRPAPDEDGWTPAQLYCLLAGAALVLAGITGWLADSSFDAKHGGSLLGFEVNGWHNLVHLLSGAVLLAAFPRHGTARSVSLGFGFVYGLVAIIGLVDGNDVLGLFGVNNADHVLHLMLSFVGLLAGAVSPKGVLITDPDTPVTVRTDDHEVISERGARFHRDYDPLSGRPRPNDVITRQRTPS